ncbi:hypothetical protein PsorP6_009776 [Peronosclerospora sorghi]|uniref:Uncharacterized protein n=1 Tax=Peronosclerospora sorghi TaxID=230839 RepID=A0ACC0VZU9_9STRA|nr:hypothetical protein PsorP6_009776 [Peronosclerospora sorghi]
MFEFNVNKLKPNLNMAVHRIGIVKNKKANAALAQRREVGRLLADKEEKARIRVEGIIRDDFTMEGYEILELMCELLAERAIAKEFKANWEPDGTQEADPLALIPAPTGATVMRASVSRSEFTALFASVRLATILSLHSFVTDAEVLMLAVRTGPSI